MVKCLLAQQGITHGLAQAGDVLAELPPMFLAIAEFDDHHTKFAVVCGFIEAKGEQIGEDVKKQLVQKCELSMMNDAEAQRLCRLNVFDVNELGTVMCSVIGMMEQNTQHKTSSQPQQKPTLRPTSAPRPEPAPAAVEVDGRAYIKQFGWNSLRKALKKNTTTISQLKMESLLAFLVCYL